MINSRGEKFDLDSNAKTTCSVCQNSFSFRDNADNVVTRCQTCPATATSCMGDSIILPQGYWRWSPDAASVIPCVLNGCPGGNSTGPFNCKPGYYGPICQVCSPGYYFSSGSQSCQSCSAGVANAVTPTQFAIFSTFIVAVFCYALIKLLRRLATVSKDQMEIATGLLQGDGRFDDEDGELEEKEAKSKTSKAFLNSIGIRVKVVMATLQVLVATPSTFSFRFPGFLPTILININVVNLDFIQILPIGCYQSTNFIQSVVATTLIPFFLIFMMAIAYRIHYFAESVRLDDTEELEFNMRTARMNYFRIVLIFTYFVLPSFSLKIFKVFDW